MKFSDTKYGDLSGQTYEGSIDISGLGLTSLEGAPEVVNGDFHCYKNQLTSLEGAPKVVNGGFVCSNNQLTSLEGTPRIVEGNFYCDNNQLTSLEGAPEVVDSFYCSKNQLNSLEYLPFQKENYTDFSDDIFDEYMKAKFPHRLI